MKWNKSVGIIEKGLAEGKDVEIKYHRKWNRNENEVRWSEVSQVSEYKFNGVLCKAIHTPFYLLDEGNWVIEIVRVWDNDGCVEVVK